MPFVKGHKKFGGKKPLPADIRNLKNIARQEIERAFPQMLLMNQSQLHKIHTSGEATAIELICARFVQQAIHLGDVQRMSIILDRFVGPIKKSELPPAGISDKEGELLQQISPDIIFEFLLQLKRRQQEKDCKSIPHSSMQQSQPSLPSSSLASATES